MSRYHITPQRDCILPYPESPVKLGFCTRDEQRARIDDRVYLLFERPKLMSNLSQNTFRATMKCEYVNNINIGESILD